MLNVPCNYAVMADGCILIREFLYSILLIYCPCHSSCHLSLVFVTEHFILATNFFDTERKLQFISSLTYACDVFYVFEYVIRCQLRPLYDKKNAYIDNKTIPLIHTSQSKTFCVTIPICIIQTIRHFVETILYKIYL